MSEQETPSEDGPTDVQPDYDRLEELVQTAQDELEDLEEVLNGHRNATDAIRDSLEAVEDRVDESQDESDPDRLANTSAFIQDAQNTLNHLEDQVGFSSETIVKAMDDLEDAIEAVEDAIDHALVGGDQVVVNVSGKTFVPEDCEMGPVEVLQAAGFPIDAYLLYYGANADEDRREPIEKGTIVNVCENRQFSAIPDEIGYGGATAKDTSGDLPAGLTAEIETLREDYVVDVVTETGDDYTHVIIRDYPIPSDGYNRNEADVMIRVPAEYPAQAPDWVYVEEEFRLANDDLPKNGRTPETHPNADPVLDGWVSLSWHINKLPSVTWTPYRTDLQWYLTTIVDGRLQRGD